MHEIYSILKPNWGAEKWIAAGWDKLYPEEKEVIVNKINELFKDGLPFELNHAKTTYLYAFSLLAQLEVLAIQIPLRFADKMPNPTFKDQMRKQLVDEVFHGLVFTKIAYLLSMPYGYPPAYNENIEEFCNYIRNEECPKVAVVLLNLVAEGWIEEFFSFFYQQNIAPRVFKVILEDEHRHVSEADLYKSIGLPSKDILEEKLAILEKTISNALFLQPQYLAAVVDLLGRDGIYAYIENLNKKHIKQLQKVNMRPSEYWRLFVDAGNISKQLNLQKEEEIELTPMKQIFLTQWDAPSDPTMVGEFDVDVTSLQIFDKVYPSYTLTTVLMQAISQMLSQIDALRVCLGHNKLIKYADVNLAIVVRLPDCNDHVGSVIFRNCHTLSLDDLSQRIKKAIKYMSFCYKMREALEYNYPKVKTNLQKFFYDYTHSVYNYPIKNTKVVSVSNMGFCGYSQAKSPLRKNESLKFTLLAVERKPVWNKASNSFEPRDILPISGSADHRIFDGFHLIPNNLRSAFVDICNKKLFTNNAVNEPVVGDNIDLTAILTDKLDDMLSKNLGLCYRLLYALQTTWFDDIDVKQILEYSEIFEKNYAL